MSSNIATADIAHWTAVLAGTHGLTARLESLDGEYDLNFRVLTDGRPSHVLKVMRPGCDPALVELQCAALAHLAQTAPAVPLPRVVPALDGASVVTRDGPDGQPRLLWLITSLDGVAYGTFRPHGPALLGELGRRVGELDAGLADFAHPGLARSFKWDLTGAGWIRPHLDLIDGARRSIITRICDEFEVRLAPALAGLPPVPIHNDINDYNILVALDASGQPRISGLIDFGDMAASPAVCEVAIAGAYVVLGQERPLAALGHLVAGYHAIRPLNDEELALVWPLLLTRLAVSVVNSAMMKRERPDDTYVTISEAPAWRLLDLAQEIAPEMALAQLRLACGKPALAAAPRILDWLSARCGSFAPVLDEDLSNASMADLSVAAPVPRDPFALEADEAAALGGSVTEGEPARLGYYAEPRLIYTGAPRLLRRTAADLHRRGVPERALWRQRPAHRASGHRYLRPGRAASAGAAGRNGRSGGRPGRAARLWRRGDPAPRDRCGRCLLRPLRPPEPGRGAAPRPRRGHRRRRSLCHARRAAPERRLGAASALPACADHERLWRRLARGREP